MDGKKHYKKPGRFMKGIILKLGSGTRLYPVTPGRFQRLLPVYDKPAKLYSLSTLMLAGIREILVIPPPRIRPGSGLLLGDGPRWGLDIRYAVSRPSRRIAQAFPIKAWVRQRWQSYALVLGDNIFYGHDLAR